MTLEGVPTRKGVLNLKPSECGTHFVRLPFGQPTRLLFCLCVSLFCVGILFRLMKREEKTGKPPFCWFSAGNEGMTPKNNPRIHSQHPESVIPYLSHRSQVWEFSFATYDQLFSDLFPTRSEDMRSFPAKRRKVTPPSGEAKTRRYPFFSFLFLPFFFFFFR